MKVRLRKRHGLLAGMVALASVGGGCIDENTGTSLDPEGPPYILQVFVLDPTSEDHSSPFVIPELVMTYGVHRNVNNCPFNVATGENDGACAAPLTCDTNASSLTFRHCVDGSGKQPISTNAVASTPFIRIVSKELLDGKTLESFACACRGAGATACPSEAATWVTSFSDCSACGDAASTATNESGQCLDINADQVPDLSSLNPGVVELACGARLAARPNVRGEGYYYPSGNQFPSSVLGWGGLGPAIVHKPTIELPTSTDCTIRVLDVVKDKDGNGFVKNPNFDATITFHTESMAVVETAPAADEEVPVDIASIDITFNVSVAEASATAANAVTVVDSMGDPVAGEVSVDGGTISFTPDAELAAGEEYTVTVAGTVTDSYGVAFGAPEEFSFTTEAAM